MYPDALTLLLGSTYKAPTGAIMTIGLSLQIMVYMGIISGLVAVISYAKGYRDHVSDMAKVAERRQRRVRSVPFGNDL